MVVFLTLGTVVAVAVLLKAIALPRLPVFCVKVLLDSVMVSYNDGAWLMRYGGYMFNSRADDVRAKIENADLTNTYPTTWTRLRLRISTLTDVEHDASSAPPPTPWPPFLHGVAPWASVAS